MTGSSAGGSCSKRERSRARVRCAAGVPEAEAARRRRRRPVSRRADVVVIGAGFAGLTAARELANDDRSVYRARGPQPRRRAGAEQVRSAAARRPRRGGTFAGPTQNHILDLAAELGVGTFPTYNEGENVYFADGTRMTYSDSGPTGTAPPDPSIIPDLATVGDPPGRDVEGGRRSTRPGRRPPPATGTARRSSSGSTRTARARASARSCPRPRGRSSAPSRARSRCSSRSSTSPRPATSATSGPSSATSTRATARRCSASRAARS